MKAMTRSFLFGCIVALTFALTGGVDATTTHATAKVRPVIYLDLTVDPCSPTPMNNMQKAALITAGYRDSILAVDSYFEGVTFRSAVGAYYKKDGWVQAGTEFLYNPNDPNLGGTFVVCSNVYDNWRWQV
jgi:hypothetical protein